MHSRIHLDLVITKEGMLPEFTIEGIEYTASRSFGRFGATVHCEMKHPEDYMPPEMSKERYERIRRICRVCNLCLLVAAVNIGVQIWWIQKKA